MIAIDRMTAGSPPAGFSFARTGQGGGGEWTVTADRTAAAGKVIEQISTDRTDYRFPLAIHESLSAANVDVEVSFKIGLYGFQCHDASLRKLPGKASVRDGSTFAAPQELQVSSQIERE